MVLKDGGTPLVRNEDTSIIRTPFAAMFRTIHLIRTLFQDTSFNQDISIS